MAPHDQGLSPASPLGENEEAESILPFNSSRLATESLSATVFQSHLDLNMEDIDGSRLRLSNSRNESLQGDYRSLLGQEDLPGRDTSYAGMTTNDDMNWLLLGFSTRINDLETAVANGNARIAHLDAQIIGLTDEFQRAIAHLKKGVKEVATAFLASGSGDSKTQT